MPLQTPLPRTIAAVVTPCVNPGVPDLRITADLCRFLNRHGCDGLFLLGSTGESPLIDEPERRALTRAAKDALGDSATLFVGAGALGAQQTLRYIRNAAEDGADAAVIMAPFFLKISQRHLIDYVTRIADQSPIPLALYHHLRMPTAFEVETILALAAHPRLVAIKDSSSDLSRITALARGLRENPSLSGFKIYQGVESLVLPSLNEGAHGCVTALANIVPGWHRDLLQAWLAGDQEKAQACQERLSRLWDLFKQPEVGVSFDRFLRVMTLPLCRNGIATQLTSMTGGTDPEFDSWLEGQFAARGLPLGALGKG